MCKKQHRALVEEVLRYLDPVIPYSDEAVELLMLTAATETHMGKFIGYLDDRSNGNGMFQMKPTTMRWLLEAYLPRNPGLANKVWGIKAIGLSWHENLRSNLFFQIAMARVYYKIHSEPIPKNQYGKMAHGQALSKYWKKHWNTSDGEGTWPKAYEDWKAHALLF